MIYSTHGSAKWNPLIPWGKQLPAKGNWQVFDVGWILSCPAALIYEASHFSNERQSVQEQGVVWEVGEGLGGTKWVNEQSGLLRIKFLNYLNTAKRERKDHFCSFSLG